MKSDTKIDALMEMATGYRAAGDLKKVLSD
jgi:hypothetical protein